MGNNTEMKVSFWWFGRVSERAYPGKAIILSRIIGINI